MKNIVLRNFLYILDSLSQWIFLLSVFHVLTLFCVKHLAHFGHGDQQADDWLRIREF